MSCSMKSGEITSVLDVPDWGSNNLDNKHRMTEIFNKEMRITIKAAVEIYLIHQK